MRVFVLLLLIAQASFAQAPNITQGPYVGTQTISRSSTVISWTTDIASTTKIKWGYNPNALTNISSAVSAGSDIPIWVHSWFISGLKGGTTVYYQVCSTANAVEMCSPTNNFATLPQTAAPADPIPPTPVDTPTTPTGTVHTVGPDCNDPTTGLVAQWQNAARGDIVEIDPTITPYCAGTYTFPPKQAGPPYILTRVKNANGNFGQRRVSPTDKPNMARFIHNAPDIIKLGAADPGTFYCFKGEYLFRQFQNNVWAIYRCNNTNPLPIGGITSNGNVTLTVLNHHIPEGFVTHVTGVTGPGAATVNGDWKIHVIDSNTIEIHPWIDSGAVQATGASGGGTIYLNAYQLEPVTEGQTPPTTPCTPGTWWHKAAQYGTEDDLHRTWYCNGADGFLPYRIDQAQIDPTLPVIDLTTNSANYLMFQGLSFEPLNLTGDGTPPQYEYYPVNYANGLEFRSFVIQSINTHHIYWDQILAGCPDPAPGVFMGRCYTFGLDMSGSNWHVGGSYFYGFQEYLSLQSLYDGSAGVFFIYHTGPHEFINNYMQCAGICIFYSDDDASTSSATDLTFKQNTIETPDKYWSESPSWLGNGLYWSQRHRFETKRLNRAILDGNQIIGGWVWINNAAGICLCTRGGAIGGQIASINNATITTYPPTAVSQGYSLSAVQVNDLVTFNNLTGPCANQINTLFHVASVISPSQITVSPPLGCTSTGGNIVRINADSNNVSDILIQNNIWLNNPTDMYLLGHDSYPGGGAGNVSTVERRIKLVNNLSVGLNNTRIGRGQFYGVPVALVPAGAHFNALLGNEDMQILNETVVHRTGGLFFGFTSSYGQGSGLTMVNNIFEHGQDPNGGWWNDGAWFGQAALDNGFSGLTPAYTASNNVVLRAGGGSGITYPYPPSTLFWDTTSGPFPFQGNVQMASRGRVLPVIPDLRIDPSLAKQGGRNGGVLAKLDGSAGGARGSQNTDRPSVGVNMDVLLAAQGKVSDVRPESITSNSATVTFLAPDTKGCSVDWSLKGAVTFTRIPNAGGSRSQSVTLTGLPGQSTIAYRINCAVERPTGSFSTP